MKIASTYKEEYKALRYGVMIQSREDSVKIEGYKQLITLASKFNWYIIKDYLVEEAKKSSVVSGAIGKLLIENKTDRALAQVIKVQDDFFSSVCMNEVHGLQNEICKHALDYFHGGAFKELNTVFNRFVRLCKDVDEDIMINLVIKNLIASVILKRFNECYNDIAYVKRNFHRYDYNIFLFLLRLIQGNYSEAAIEIFEIQPALSEETILMINNTELQFDFLIVLLLTFQREWTKNLVIRDDTLIYEFNESHPDFYQILQKYTNCNYESVLTDYEKLLPAIRSDPFLGNNIHTITSSLKINILKEILISSRRITYEVLKKLLREDNVNTIESWVTLCIEKNNMNVSIDDVEKAVYCIEKAPIDMNVDACLKMGQKNIVDSMSFLLENTIFYRIDKKASFEKKNLVPRNLNEGEFHMNMMMNS